MSARYGIRYADSDPYGRGGVIVGEFTDRDQAERICRALLSPADVVELPDEHPSDLEETPTP